MTTRARLVVDGARQLVCFRCPGCREEHRIRVRVSDGSRPQWAWNGSLERPTLVPSVDHRTNPRGHHHYQPDEPSSVCHFFLTSGRLQFLADSTHALAGQTVELPVISPSV